MADETPTTNPTTPPTTPVAPPAASAAPPPNPPAAPGAAAPPALTIPLDEYRHFLGQQAELERVRAESAAAAERKETERLRALAEKGQAEEALKQQRDAHEARLREAQEKFASLESEVLAERRQTAVSRAVAGAKFISKDAADQFVALVLPGLEARRTDAGIEVRDRTTLKPAAEVVAAALASPAYAHFLEPSSRGGAGGGGNQPPPAPPGGPRNLGEETIAAALRLGLKPGANPLAFPAAARN